MAYPSAPLDVRETLAKEQFIDSLVDSEMRLRIKQSRPKNLNEAVRLAVELEAFNKAECKALENKGYLGKINENIDNNRVSNQMQPDLYNLVQTMQQSIQNLTTEVSHLKSMSERSRTRDVNIRRGWNYRGKRCFNCGKMGHLFRKCPFPSNKLNTEKYDKSQGGKNKENETKGDGKVHTLNSNKNDVKIGQGAITSASDEAGMYIELQIQGMKSKFLVDTGATLTLVSERLYNKMPHCSKPTLGPVKTKVKSVCGNQLDLKGKGSFTFKIKDMTVCSEAVVTNLSPDGILGLDFLRAHNCKIDVTNGIFEMYDQNIPLTFEGSFGCYRVVTSESVSIPPRSGVVIYGKVCLAEGQNLSFDEALIEATEQGSKDDILTARTLVKVSDDVPVRLMNLDNSVKTVYAGTTVAQLSEVKQVSEKSKSDKMIDISNRPDLTDLLSRTSDKLTFKERQKVEALVNEYANLFASSDTDLGRTSLVEHEIHTGNARPHKEPPRRTPMHLSKVVDDNLDKMLKNNIIEPSISPWAAGIVLVKKKDNSYRFCVDYRMLNKSTVNKDAYPLPHITESLDHLSGNVWYSTLDCFSGYWQVPLSEKSKHKTAFATKRGLFQFKVMPFGLCCAAQTFERLMESVLAGLQWEICLVYLDDIIVFGKTLDHMLDNLRQVFDRLKMAGLKLKAKKCTLCATEVNYLGHVISKDGIATDPGKISAVKNWPEPVNTTEVRSFIGLCSYYRKFIKNFAEITKCLHRLTEKNQVFKWTAECQEAFDRLKFELTNAPILTHPDFTREFILDTDASNLAIGAVLSQKSDDGKERVVAYASRTLSKAERRYCVTRKELLSVVHFVRHFKPYLLGRKFIVRTDHSSLRWLLNFKNPEGQLARWMEQLSEYDMEIRHRPGSQHKNADALSRIPCKQCGYTPEWEVAPSQISTIVGKTDKCLVQDESFKQGKSLKELQSEDPDIRLVKDWVQNGKRPLYCDISGNGNVIRSLWCQWDSLYLENDILFRKYEDPVSNMVLNQALVPLSERKTVLQFCHDNKCSAHLGVHKTVAKVRQGYYWPGLQGDVRAYIAGCDKCSKRKSPQKTKRAPMGMVQVSCPMDRLATDILGELPETENGNRYILVVSDYFTKWTESFPMRNMEASTVAKIIVEEVIVRYGVPSYIHSDQGRQFESKLFQEVCDILNIKKTRTTPYHPQSDGMVERFNKTLVTMLSSYVSEHQRDWDKYIPYVMMAYRSAEHETTGQTPNRLMLGREVSTPLDIMYEMPPSIKQIPENRWAWELKERMEEAHSFVRNKAKGEMRRQKRYYDRKLSYQRFEKDDDVYVFFPVRKSGCSSKLTSFWKGPYKVLEKYGDLTYKVDCGQGGRPQVIHVDRMKRKYTQTLRGEDQDDIESLDKTSGDFESTDTVEMPSSKTKYWVEDENTTGRRVRKKPVWMSDYVVD